jgi:hypothetical protein
MHRAREFIYTPTSFSIKVLKRQIRSRSALRIQARNFKKIAQNNIPMLGQYRLWVKLHTKDRLASMLNRHDRTVGRPGSWFKAFR